MKLHFKISIGVALIGAIVVSTILIGSQGSKSKTVVLAKEELNTKVLNFRT